MKRQVYMYHGYSVTLYDDLIKLVGCYPEENEDGDDVLYFDGTLDEFVSRWKRPVMIVPNRNTDGPGIIGVTQHSNFGQR